jgi:hypothetical protein
LCASGTAPRCRGAGARYQARLCTQSWKRRHRCRLLCPHAQAIGDRRVAEVIDERLGLRRLGRARRRARGGEQGHLSPPPATCRRATRSRS